MHGDFVKLVEETLNEGKKQVMAKDVDDYKGFVKYFDDFYGKKGLYPIIGLTKKDIDKGIELRLKSRDDMEWSGDSADRELVRDEILAWRKQKR
jgi:hypothetical protein